MRTTKTVDVLTREHGGDVKTAFRYGARTAVMETIEMVNDLMWNANEKSLNWSTLSHVKVCLHNMLHGE